MPDRELFQKATELQQTGQLEEAAEIYRQLSAAKGPLAADALINAGAILDEQGLHEEALRHYQEAMRLRKPDPVVLNNMGNTFMKLGRFQQAVACFREALAHAPDRLETKIALGAALQREGDAAAAISCFREVLRRDPACAEAHWNLSLALLVSGDFREGWREYEWRWRKDSFTSPSRHFKEPLWDGSPLAGRRILVHAEQGLGDTIQFMRYLPLLAAAGGIVIAECQSSSLLPLVRRVCGVSAVCVMGDALPSFDVQVPLLSLPHLFDTTLDSVPREVPYILPDPERLDAWRARISSPEGYKVGVVWAGKRVPDPFRSCDVSDLAPLAGISGVTLYSLQLRADTGTAPPGLELVDLTASIADFGDTASLVSLLDLVISVDTAVAHLAGALGKPVWLMLPKAGDYRWLLQREDSPWYPSMKIFRQERQGEWGAVMERVSRELKGAVQGFQERTAMEGMGTASPPDKGSRAGIIERRKQAVRALPAQGRFSEVAIQLQMALELHPGDVTVMNDLGCALDNGGRHAEAIAVYEKALALAPDFMPLHYNLGNSLKSLGRCREAVMSYRRALTFEPGLPQGWHNLALAHQESGQLDEAKHALERALLVQPDYLEARHNLGELHYLRGDIAAAGHCFREILARDPRHLPSWNALGIALQTQGRLEEAATCFGEALSIKPDYLHALNNLGAVSKSLGRYQEAEELYLEVLRHDPEYADARWNLSLVQLLQGRYEEGWRGYEWRFRKIDPVRQRSFTQPLWDGGTLAGRTILLHAEQGFGDTLQFVRYATVLSRMGARVLVECQSEAIAPVLATVPGVVRVLVRGEQLPWFDCHAPLMSLPLLCGTRLETVPAEIPYLRADPELVEQWRPRIGGEGLRVGLIWAGRRTYKDDARRSLHLNLFALLRDIAGVGFFSLQMGDGAEQAAAPPQGLELYDFGKMIETFADTAAIVENLDLVITVDTAVAHLAGALGRRVWVLLPTACDWRWLLERDDSPWYPSARLFRQRQRGDWREVLARVARELAELASAASRVRQAGE